MTRPCLGAVVLASFALFALACAAQGQDIGRGVRGNAGILAYTCDKGTAQFMFAQEIGRGQVWTYPGGRPAPDPGTRPPPCTRLDENDREPHLATALCAFHEEKHCAVPFERKQEIVIRGPSARPGRQSFSTYLTEGGFVEPGAIRASQRCNTSERIGWTWVPHDQVLKVAEGCSTSMTDAAGVVRPVCDEPVAALLKARENDLIGPQGTSRNRRQ